MKQVRDTWEKIDSRSHLPGGKHFVLITVTCIPLNILFMMLVTTYEFHLFHVTEKLTRQLKLAATILYRFFSKIASISLSLVKLWLIEIYVAILDVLEN